MVGRISHLKTGDIVELCSESFEEALRIAHEQLKKVPENERKLNEPMPWPETYFEVEEGYRGCPLNPHDFYKTGIQRIKRER